ncbi:MAG: hypothetical protein HZB42_13050 [Sphingobacteriales bacterium]|nr:hypothetical protein [Sphingobacteriales bacterium]
MLARVLGTSEMAFVRTAGMRTTLAGSTTRLAITNEALAMRNLARLRIRTGALNKKYIYLPEQGSAPLYELINSNTVRCMQTGVIDNLPFRIFRTNGLARAELRSGPGGTYKLYKTISKDQWVLVRGEVQGWYKVQVDDMIGWIAVAALSPSIIEDPSSEIVYTDIECYNCNGEGTKSCTDCNTSGIEDCPSCKGFGSHKCTNCKGVGNNPCLICKDKNKEGCISCRGIGYLDCKACKTKGYFECRICRATGKIPCDVCDGTLHTKCYFCFGTKNITERVIK